MATSAQLIANRENAQSSTGPVTPEGKSIASKNHLSAGLFTQGDFIRADEQTEYDDLTAALQDELSPVGAIEQTYATEVLSATWRLRRCIKVEAAQTATADDQSSIDRVRANAHNILRRSIAELRRLQTERQIRNAVYPEGSDISELGLAGTKETIAAHTSFHRDRLISERVGELDEFSSLLDKATGPGKEYSGSYRKAMNDIPAALKKAANLTENAPATAPAAGPVARNSLCPCRSGQKYKRCCGVNAPAILGNAA